MTQLHNAKNQGGYVALISVLIIGAVATAIALGLLVNGTDSQRSALVSQQSAQARTLANACADEALQVMHDTTSYTGTNNMSLGSGTCSYTVTSTGASTRIVDTVGTVNNVVRRVKIYVTITSSNLSITSWQEVSDA